jgi:putative sigma-54 modulation protein
MLTSIDITGVRYTPDETTKRYVMAKIGRLDRYVSRHARKTISADVKLREVNRDHGNKYECEVIIRVPDATITATESTLNMLAAVDIVEAKLRTQLKKYKDEHTDHNGRHNLLGRLKRQLRRSRSEPETPTLDAV